MKTFREEVITIKDSKGLKVDTGDTVYLVSDGKTILAEFVGIGSRGAWMFAGLDELANEYFSIAPRAIKEMYKVGDRYGI